MQVFDRRPRSNSFSPMTLTPGWYTSWWLALLPTTWRPTSSN